MEADWHKFRAMIPIWRERYLAERNVEIAKLIKNPRKTETERFWDAEERIRNDARTLRRCLDGTSRSRMSTLLFEMRAAGMLKRTDLADFSPELQRMIFHEPD